MSRLKRSRIVSEYEEVLSRQKFSFKKTDVDHLMEFIGHFGIPVSAAPFSRHLHDRDDEAFLEVAISGKAECIITGNVTHYPAHSRGKVRVFAPRQFINRYF